MRAIIVLFALRIAAGQAFDAASIHRDDPSVPPKFRMSAHGGPGSEDPKRFTCRGCPLALLIAKAYDVEISQVEGPDWMWGDLFEVAAIVPDHTSIDQFHSMLQSLLVERFKLKSRRETREVTGYDLTRGPDVEKLKEAGPPTPPEFLDGPPRVPSLDSDGFPKLAPGQLAGVIQGRSRFHLEYAPPEFANWLTIRLQKQVIDRTGLTARFDITLSFFEQYPGQPAPDVPLPTLVDAVNKSWPEASREKSSGRLHHNRFRPADSHRKLTRQRRGAATPGCRRSLGRRFSGKDYFTPLATRGARNSSPVFHVGRRNAFATFTPIVIPNRANCSMPEKSQSS